MSANGGCGCGCSGKAKTATPARREDGFLRPQFFSNMLLTQDDLQGVVDYLLAKRRLTNRHMFGPGVVCGLEVTCHPCETGKVRVASGYALECCGNDIVVNCPEDVDVLRLVRELRQRKGVDCGEPCDDQPQLDYYLYVRYEETPTAPVAPYATDDCATGDCEFSRVREGYSFELRCEPPDAQPSLCGELAACKPSEDLEYERKDIERLVRHAELQEMIAARVAAGTEPIPAIPTKTEFDAVEAGELAIEPAFEVVKRSALTLALDAAAARGAAPSPGLNEARRTLLATRSREVARKVLDSPAFAEQPADERVRMERILTLAVEQPDLSRLTVAERAWLGEGTTEAEAERMFVKDARRIKGRVLSKLADVGSTGCAEYRKLAELEVTGLQVGSSADAAVLARAYDRALRECACAAVHPPCLECTDPGVALAKVRVDGCEVTDVCSLARRWVPSPRALQYWAPVVDHYRGRLAEHCCDPEASGRSVLAVLDPICDLVRDEGEERRS